MRTHPDYINLKQCVQQISGIAEEVNEKCQQKVLEIQNKVEILRIIIDLARRFIYQGDLYKATNEWKGSMSHGSSNNSEEKIEWITRIDTALKVLKRGIRNNP
ncbi:10316_t:CDS:2, partial [Gigaspora rosea]